MGHSKTPLMRDLNPRPPTIRRLLYQLSYFALAAGVFDKALLCTDYSVGWRESKSRALHSCKCLYEHSIAWFIANFTEKKLRTHLSPQFFCAISRFLMSSTKCAGSFTCT